MNNEVGAKSVAELARLLAPDSEGDLNDLRFTSIKASKHDLNLLLQQLSRSSNANRLTRLRLSYVEINEFVLMQSLTQTVYNLPQLQELNLCAVHMHGKQFAELMTVIQEQCGQLAYLNLSQNQVPLNKEWLTLFVSELSTMICESQKLIDINLAGMNLRESVSEIMLPLAKSKTLQAIHLSDNNIPRKLERRLLKLFGIQQEAGAEDFSIAGGIDMKLVRR